MASNNAEIQDPNHDQEQDQGQEQDHEQDHEQDQDQDCPVIRTLWAHVRDLEEQNASLREDINQIRSQIQTNPLPGQPAPAPAPASAYDVGYAYPPPWTIQFHRDTNTATLSQEPASAPSDGPQQANQAPAATAAPTASGTTMVGGNLVQTGQAASGSGSVSLPAPEPGQKLSVHPGLKPNFAAGPLTDPRGGQLRYMYARPNPPRFDGVFNKGYVQPLVDQPGDWKYFTEGMTENSAYGTAEQVAHKKLGGQGPHFRNNMTTTADQVEKLREEQSGSLFQDPTSGIDISWVPELNLDKDRRAGRGVSVLPHYEQYDRDETDQPDLNEYRGNESINPIGRPTSFSNGSPHRQLEPLQPAQYTSAPTSAITPPQQQHPPPENELPIDGESSGGGNEHIDANETAKSAENVDERLSVEDERIPSNAAHNDTVLDEEIPQSGRNFGWEPRSEANTQARGVETIDTSNQIKPRLRSDVTRASVADATASTDRSHTSRPPTRARPERQNSTASLLEGRKPRNTTVGKPKGRKGAHNSLDIKKLAGTVQFLGLGHERSDTAQERKSSEVDLIDRSRQKKVKRSERREVERAEDYSELEGTRPEAPADAMNDEFDDEDEDDEMVKEAEQAQKGQKRGKKDGRK